MDIESGGAKLVDYSSSESEDLEDLDQDNIRNGGIRSKNLEEDTRKCEFAQNRMDIRRVAVVQPQMQGQVGDEENSEGTGSDIEHFEQTLDQNQQAIGTNLETGIQENFEEMLENVSNQNDEQAPVPPSSPVETNLPLSTPVNFMEAFQAFLNVRGSAEMSESDEDAVEITESPSHSNDQDLSDMICISSDDSQTTEIYSPTHYTQMSSQASPNQSEPVVISDSMSDTSGM